MNLRQALRFSLFLTVLLAVRITHAQSNLVMMVSPPGDYIGEGLTYITTNPADFSLSGTPGGVTIQAFGFTIQFTPPYFTNLTVGVYTNAVRYPSDATAAGLDIYGNGRGCNTSISTFQIFEMHTNANGRVDRFWATFSHSCEGYMPALTGDVRYCSLLAPPPPDPRTLLVPSEYPSIGAAMNAANLLALDTILVAPGTYRESVRFGGKRAVLTSQSGPGQTFIVPPAGSAGVIFDAGETEDAVISGFTVTNAATGVSVSSSSPTVLSNVIAKCGYAVYCSFASPMILDNLIFGSSTNALYLGGAGYPVVDGNVIQDNASGISMWAAGNPLIQNNIIRRNHGDAMNMVNRSDANIIQNLILDNDGNGMHWLVPSGARGPYVFHNTIVGNGRVSGAGISADGFDANSRIINNIVIGSPALTVGTFNDLNPPITQFNDFFSTTGVVFSGAISNLTGIAGNISADPLFINRAQGDYRLQPGSPVIDAGTNGLAGLPSTDFEGFPRVMDGNCDGQSVADMGAYEYVPSFSLVCTSNVVQNSDPNQCSSVVNYPLPNASCAGVAVTCSPPPGSAFSIGTTTVSCVATSIWGQTETCTFTVTVVDKQPPSITCPANITTNTAPGQCSALVKFAPAVSDNCDPNPTVVCTPPSGSTFSKGTNTVACVAVDSSGNTNTCLFTVTVLDKQPPTIVCPSNIVVSAGVGKCTAVVNYPAPAASDNCSAVNVVSTPPSGSAFPTGTNTVTCTATDAAGNQASCSFTIIVTNTQVPNAPTGLTARALSRTQVALAWTDNACNESGYRIERVQGKNFTQIATVGANVTTFTDNSVARNKTYTYRVRAYNAYGNSAYSNTATVTTPR